VKAPIDVLGLSNGARSGLTGFVAGASRSKIAASGVTMNNLLPGAFDTDRLKATFSGARWKRPGSRWTSVHETTPKIAVTGRRRPDRHRGTPADERQGSHGLCGARGDETRCAKVYKEATQRSFRQAVDYTENRKVKNSRQARAMAKGTRFGREAQEAAWQSAEVDALYRLAAAGVRVPKPYNFHQGVLLMELVTDEHGDAAPRLNDVTSRQSRLWPTTPRC
jgi:hypothetical protein